MVLKHCQRFLRKIVESLFLDIPKAIRIWPWTLEIGLDHLLLTLAILHQFNEAI